jgi:hypothetical protein
MISRTDAEHLRLKGILGQLVTMTNAGIGDSKLFVSYKPSVITSEAAYGMAGLDLIFEPDSRDESRYWQHLEGSYKQCLRALSELTSDL